MSRSKIRRGNYVFLTWVSDHPPKHVHVFRGKRLVLKWNLDDWTLMRGTATRRILRHLRELREEGKL